MTFSQEFCDVKQIFFPALHRPTGLGKANFRKELQSMTMCTPCVKVSPYAAGSKATWGLHEMSPDPGQGPPQTPHAGASQAPCPSLLCPPLATLLCDVQALWERHELLLL